MVNRRIVAALVAMTAIAAVNLLGACTPSDDNDGFIPTQATPAPTVAPRNCQVVVASQSVVSPELVDVYVVDGPAEEWINGTGLMAPHGGFAAYYEEGVDLSGTHVYAPDSPVAVATTAGSFTIFLMGLNGTKEGAPIGVGDTVDFLEAVVDTAGTIAVVGSSSGLDFQGVWSSADPTTALDIDNLAIVDIALDGDPAFSIGDYGGYGVCYDVE